MRAQQHGAVSDSRQTMAQPPWGTALMNKLYLLSPKLWIKVLNFWAIPTRIAPPLNLDVLVRGSLNILVPMMALLMISSLYNHHIFSGVQVGLLDDHTMNSGRLLLSAIVSPWTLGNFYKMKPELDKITSRCRIFRQLRAPPLEDALVTLQERIDHGRAYRTRHYDVYLPEKHLKTIQQGVLLLPGASISHAAYAQVAAQLSDYGILVVVVSAEPFRISLLADAKKLQQIIKNVAKTSGLTIQEWSLCGHSMGGYAAMQLVQDMKPRKLVLWAAGHLSEMRTNLRQEQCRVLLLEASCDDFCVFTKQGRRDFLSTLPNKPIAKMIPGGDHHGFASYNPPMMNKGTAKIPRQRQHELVVAETAKFLLQD